MRNVCRYSQRTMGGFYIYCSRQASYVERSGFGLLTADRPRLVIPPECLFGQASSGFAPPHAALITTLLGSRAPPIPPSPSIIAPSPKFNMVSSTVTTLKFVGSISLGLLTGVSYTLSTLTVPTLITLPSASAGFKAFSDLKAYSQQQLSILTAVSTGSFVLSFLLSPRRAKHPYLIWTSLIVLGGFGYDAYTQSQNTRSLKVATKKKKTIKIRRSVEQSYENLGDSASDGTESEASEEDVNGEEVKAQMEQFGGRMLIQTIVTGVSFAMSLVGIWGDGA